MSNQWCDTCGGLVDRIGLQPQGVRFCECRTTIEKLRAKLADAKEGGKQLTEAQNCIQTLEKDLAAERERADKAEAEVARLNQWADGMTDAVLKERETGEMYQRELRAERDTLRAELAALRIRAEQAEAELQEMASVLPGVAYMDPPDGGSPSIAEQVRRMRAENERLREALISIAENSERLAADRETHNRGCWKAAALAEVQS